MILRPSSRTASDSRRSSHGLPGLVRGALVAGAVERRTLRFPVAGGKLQLVDRLRCRGVTSP